jgi:hypothetical protein
MLKPHPLEYVMMAVLPDVSAESEGLLSTNQVNFSEQYSKKQSYIVTSRLSNLNDQE